jgi:homocysteine S-methyltransferase
MSYTTLQKRLRNGDIILLDGGTGTELEKRGVLMDSEAWCGPATLKNADILEGVHRDYIAAGADVITANTYASSRLMLEPAGFADKFEETNRAAVAIAHRARKASGRTDLLVAGSLSHLCPITADSNRPDLDREPPADEMRAAFHELATLLCDAGCDLILLEMMYYPHRIPLVFEAALSTGLPVWAGFSLRRDTQSQIVSYAPEQPIPITELFAILDRTEVQAAGLMHTSSDVIGDGITLLRQQYEGPLMAYPDSGYFRMPHWKFEDVIEPDVLVGFARTWIDAGVQILGGCCGLSPVHIAALREAFG